MIRHLVPILAGLAAAAASAGEPVDLADRLELIRARHKVPALGGVVVRANRVIARGVTGVRRQGDQTRAGIDDRWHHGSNTKSMTATLAALLVAEGALRWDSTLAEVFPEQAGDMRPAWRAATLEQLLANRGGAPAHLEAGGLWQKLWNHAGTPREGRALVLREVTGREPAYPPGTENLYSNGGFTLAGHMLETTADQDWEALVTEKLFEPLGMTSAAFGAPGTPGKVDQPWGHEKRLFGLNAISPGPRGDNPPTIGPAGTVHASLEDMARYLGLHLAGARGEPTVLLGRDAFRKLHADVADQGYALGWSVLERGWGGGEVLHHGGSNTMWYSNIWIAPKKDFALLAVTNANTKRGFAATDEVIGSLIRLIEKPP